MNLQEISVLENDIKTFKTIELKNVQEEIETKRINFLECFNRRVFYGLVITFILILNWGLVIAGIIDDYYSHLKIYLDNILLNYEEWYQNLNPYISFFVPSRIIIWDLPGIAGFNLLIIVIAFLYSIVPLLKYYNMNAAAKIIPIFMEKLPGLKLGNNDKMNFNWYANSRLLTKFDNWLFSNVFTDKYKDSTIQLFETKFIKTFSSSKFALNNIVGVKYNKSIFNGIIVNIFNDELFGKLDLKEEDIIILNYKLGGYDNNKEEVNFSDLAQIKVADPIIAKKVTAYCSYEDSAKNFITKEMINVIKDIGEFIESSNIVEHTLDKHLIDIIKNKYRNLDKELFYQIPINCNIRLEIRNNYILLTIPLNKELFKQNSIFASAVDNTDFLILTNILKNAYIIIDYLTEKQK